MKYKQYFFIFLFIFWATPLLAQLKSNNYFIRAGYCHPGLVWQYSKNEKRRPFLADPEKINRDVNTYVLIHGAHSGSTHSTTDEIVKEMRLKDPDANYLAVDWGYWANFRADQYNDITNEALSSILLKSTYDTILNSENQNGNDLLVNFTMSFLKTTLTSFDIPKAMIRTQLYRFASIQAEKIPIVAERIEKILFDIGRTELETENQYYTAQCLGLDPEKTHLIGFGHGAHVAGHIGMIVRKREKYTQIKRITCFSPSSPALYLFDIVSKELIRQEHYYDVSLLLDKLKEERYPECFALLLNYYKELDLINKYPEEADWFKWDKSAATFVDVYRLSEDWSIPTLYGHLNLEFHVNDCRWDSIILFYYLLRDVDVFLEIAKESSDCPKAWVRVKTYSSLPKSELIQ